MITTPRFDILTEMAPSLIDAMVVVRKSDFRSPAHIARAIGTSK